MIKSEFLLPPPKIGQLEPNYLATIGAQFPEIDTQEVWYLNPDERQPNNPSLLEALQSFTDLLIAQTMRDHNQEPRSIGYTLDTRTIAPRHVQRTERWHIDQGGCKAAVVSSSLPTEFYIQPEPHDEVATAKVQKLIFTNQLDDLLPDDNPAHIFHPVPCDVVFMGKNIHRSPINPHTEPVKRVWIRAAIGLYDHGRW